MSSKTINQRVLDSVGRQNYEMYMLLTNGEEVDEILDDCSPVFQMYNYRDMLLDLEVGQNIDMEEIEQLLKDNEDIKLRQKLELLFLENLSGNNFNTIKDILVNHTFGWNIKRLVEIHKKHKGYRIFRILSINYNDWLN